MKRLSEYRGEQAIEVMGDILEPATIIMGDPEIRKLNDESTSKVKIVKYILKNHRESVLQIMAVLDGVDIDDKKAYEDYRKSVNFFTLPMNLLSILNDPDVQSLFTSQGQMMGSTFSTPASEKSQENE